MVEFYGWPDTEVLPEPEDVEGEAALVALLELLEMDPERRVTDCDEPTERELHWKIRSEASTAPASGPTARSVLRGTPIRLGSDSSRC